jgi:predicted NBD/HSP70 family sugar kinase
MLTQSSANSASKELAEFFRSAPSRVEVFRTIYHFGELSRAEIARLTGLTKVTVSDVVSQLNALGLIRESEPQRSSAPGKPPILVQLNRDSIRAIAVDISSSKLIRTASIDLYGRVLSSSTVPFAPLNPEALLKDIITAIELEIDAHDVTVLGIGLGAAGVVDNLGQVVDGAALGLHDFPLQARLTERFGVEVRVGNDANVATKADALFGGGHSSHLLVRISQGVGAGLILDSNPYLGSNFAAGELGHVVVQPGGHLCGCGKLGCLEAEVSTLLSQNPPDTERVGSLLGKVLAPIASVLNLSEIVVSTYPEAEHEGLLTALFGEIESVTLPEISQHLTVRFSRLGNDIVLLGAAALALSAVLGVS